MSKLTQTQSKLLEVVSLEFIPVHMTLNFKKATSPLDCCNQQPKLNKFLETKDITLTNKADCIQCYKNFLHMKKLYYIHYYVRKSFPIMSDVSCLENEVPAWHMK